MLKNLKLFIFSLLKCLKAVVLNAQSLNPLNISTGKWVKLEFNQTGVFKIDYKKLEEWGFDPSTINPHVIRFFSVQGEGLPVINDSIDSWKTLENPIKIVGAEDGVFDPQDYILLFRKISRGWNYQNGNFKHFINQQSNKSFGILGYAHPTSNAAENLGKRITEVDKSNGSGMSIS